MTEYTGGSQFICEEIINQEFQLMKNQFSKPILYWAIRKSFTNNFFILCEKLIPLLSEKIKEEKVLIWLKNIKALCELSSKKKEPNVSNLLSIILQPVWNVTKFRNNEFFKTY